MTVDVDHPDYHAEAGGARANRASRLGLSTANAVKRQVGAILADYLPLLLVPILLNVVLAAAAWAYLGSAIAWSAPGRTGANPYLAGGIAFLQFPVLAALADRLVKALLIDRGKARHEQAIPALAFYLGTAVIYLIAVSASYRLVFGQSLETVLAASGVVGLVLGFALRGLLSDIFSGIVLHLDPTIHNGDMLRLNHRGTEMEARLINFEWRCAVLHDTDANTVLIPNSEFAQLRMLNLTSPEPFSWYAAKISVSADRPPSYVSPILKNAADRAAADGIVLKKPAPHILVSDTVNGLTDYSIRYALPPNASRRSAKDRVLRYALQFLHAAGVSMTPMTYQGLVPLQGETAVSNNFALQEVRARVLANVPFFTALNHAELDYIAEHTAPHRFPGGSRVIVAGDTGDSMFLVLEGRLDVVVDSENGPVIVASLWPGDCFGEMSLFTGAPRTATIIALEAVQVIEVTKDIIAALFERNPHLAHAVAEVIEARSQATRRTLDDLNKTVDTPELRTETLFGKIRSFFKLA
jgi:small-conductance mechanosensitive channel